MAKVNLAISAAENVLSLINASNQGLNATIANVVLGTPAASVTGVRNTSITLSAVTGLGFKDAQTFAYGRQALAAGAAIATSKGNSVEVAVGDDDQVILAKAATALGLLVSELSISNVVQAVDSATPGSASITAPDTSLLYTGSFAIVLTVPAVSLPDAAPNTDAGGFDPEA